MTGITGDTYSAPYLMDYISTLSVESIITVTTGSAETFLQDNVSTANDTFPTLANTFPLGLKVRATSTGTLPTGITTGVDYFVIPVTADTISLATSLANALTGTKIDITATGTAAATGTFTPTSLAGGTVSYQMTNVTNALTGSASTTATDWDDIATATAVTVAAHSWFTKIGPEYKWFRIKGSATAGSLKFVNYLVGKGSDKS